jgi:hypothetical protein
VGQLKKIVEMHADDDTMRYQFNDLTDFYRTVRERNAISSNLRFYFKAGRETDKYSFFKLRITGD